MALEAGLQPLHQAGAQGLTKAENHRGRRRVVIEAIGAPVALELDEVEVVAADLRPAASEHRFGPGIVGDGSEPGGTGEAFLRPRHDDVGIPAVRGHLAAAQRDHGRDSPSRAAFEPVKRYTVAKSATWAQPAISGNRIFVKDISTLALWTVD